MTNPRKTAFNILYKIETDKAFSSILIKNIIRENNLSGLDAAFVSAMVYGVLERLITLDYIISRYSKLPLKKVEKKTLVILRMGLYQIIYMDKVPDSAAVNESVKLAKKLRLSYSSGYINGVLRSFLRDGAKIPLPCEKDNLARLSVEYSCPQEVIKMWIDSYGAENTLGILKSLFDRPPLYCRVNTLGITPEDLIPQLEALGVEVKRTALDTCLEISNTGFIQRLKPFEDGLFYIQDMSSQLCVKLSNIRPHHIVSDVCAAPGGKSVGAAIDMENRGKVNAFDLYGHKVELIRNAAVRLGAAVCASVRDAKSDKSDGILSDRVFCDVPCGGLGIIRRKPEIRYKPDVVNNGLPEIQYEILKNSARLTAYSGLLVYSTCTLNPAENGEVADRFLRENPDFEPYPIILPPGIKRGIDEPSNQLTLFPHINNTDGFFISIFKRRG